MGLTITTSTGEPNTTVTLSLEGQIDTHTSGQLDQAIQEVCQRSARVLVLDMAKVGFISSAGVGVIIKAQETLKKQGGELTLAQLQPQIKRVFEIMQLTPILNVCATQQELDDYLAKIQKRIVEEGTSLSIDP